MSDGALSQEEIDSLLAGLDTGGGGGKQGSAPGASAAQTASREAQFFKSILEGATSAQSQNLSMITGLDVTVGSPQVDQVQRDAVLQSVPEEVLAVQIDMTGGIPGEHLFVLSKETAIHIASLANKDDSLTDLDDMAISAVSECVSTLDRYPDHGFYRQNGQSEHTILLRRGKLCSQGHGAASLRGLYPGCLASQYRRKTGAAGGNLLPVLCSGRSGRRRGRGRRTQPAGRAAGGQGHGDAEYGHVRPLHGRRRSEGPSTPWVA